MDNCYEELVQARRLGHDDRTFSTAQDRPTLGVSLAATEWRYWPGCVYRAYHRVR